MSNSSRIQRVLIAVTLATTVTACEDVPSPTPAQKVSPVVSADPPKPTELPPPPVAVLPPKPNIETEVGGGKPSVETDDDAGPEGALTGARKKLIGGDTEGAFKLAKIAVLHTPETVGRVEHARARAAPDGQAQGRDRLVRKSGRAESAQLIRPEQPGAGADLRETLHAGGRRARAGGRARAGRGLHVEQPRHGVRAAGSPRGGAGRLRQGGRDGERPCPRQPGAPQGGGVGRSHG